MRITSGEHKGRRVQMPGGIRPTQNKVRKALFDILGDIQGLSFLELFAGSGAVGFEAVSRGISWLVLVEDSHSCQRAIKANIESLKSEICTLCPMEAGKAIEMFSRGKVSFDLIFLDPPYYQDSAKKTLQTLSACDILSPDGLVVVQHETKNTLPDTLGVLSLIKKARYGDTSLSFYRKKG